MLREAAFFGKPDGHSVIMSDNCVELRNALRETWPKSNLLLCVFHILQQVWRWLFDKSHGITKSDRVDIMKHFRKLVYARTVIDFDDITDKFMNSYVLNKYKNAVLYFNNLLELKTNWAHCFRTNLVTRGTNTNNYVEAQFLVIKDTILQRNHQFNVNMLLDKLLKEFENHFKLKLLSVADGTFDGIYSNRFKGTSKDAQIGTTVIFEHFYFQLFLNPFIIYNWTFELFSILL